MIKTDGGFSPSVILLEEKMAKICPLFSGSTGNSTYVGTSQGSFLVDAGGSYKSICTAISNAGGSVEDLRAIAVTHEHIDHVKGLKTLLKTLKIPLIASKKTLETLISEDKIPADVTLICAEDENCVFGDVQIQRFATSHDCEGSSGYRLTLPDGKGIAVCTDLGVMTDEIRNNTTGCELVLLESNHDIQMLKRGPYPPQLKLRILSDVGHLSNIACASELPMLLKNGTTRFILGHLSQKNNLPMLALSAARASLMDIGAEQNKDYLLYVARPDRNEVFPL